MIIYYMDIYNKLKDKEAKYLDDKEFDIFAKLYEWKENDKKRGVSNDERGNVNGSVR